MTVRKGHEAEISIERISAGGYGIVGEEIYAAGQSLAEDDVLETRLYPIVDDNGDETVAVADVAVYASGNAVGEGAFTLSTNGQVVMTSGADLSGLAITIDYNYKRTVGYAQGMSWSVETALDPAHVIGQRNPKEIKAGAVEITGNIDEFFVDRNAFEQATDRIGGNLIDFDVTVTDNPDATSPITTKFSDVKFGTWNLDLTNDGFTGNNVDFTATNINCSQG